MVLTGWMIGLGSLALCAWQGLCSAFGFVTEGEERSDEPEVEEPKWGRPLLLHGLLAPLHLCSSLCWTGCWRRLCPIGLCRCFIAQRLVWPPGVVVLHPPVHSGLQLGHFGVFLQVDVLVFDASPEPLDKHVVHPPPPPVHADLHAPFLEPAGPLLAGKLAALVGVKDLRHAACARLCTLQRQQAQAGVHRVAHCPAKDAARVPLPAAIAA